MGGDPIPTPFSWRAKQFSETRPRSQFKSILKPITKLEKHPSTEDCVVRPREKLGKDAYRCKPNEGLVLTSHGVMVVIKPSF